MRVFVMLNEAAGTLIGSSTNGASRRIRERFASLNVEADVREVPGADLVRVAAEARESGTFDFIVAGGGDGTLNTIAGALVGGSVPFAVLPLGTFNHLAKELEIPLELDAAIDALVTGRTTPFNVGKVNDRYFLSFAAIGIYSDMIKHRDAQRRARGRKKMWAGTIAGIRMLFRWPLKRVAISVDAHPAIKRLTPVVYVSLSGLQIDQMGIQGRPDHIRERLNIFVAMQKRRLGLLKLLARAAFRHVRVTKDVDLFRASRCEVAVRGHRHVRVGYDGEVETMTLPLRFELVRGGLQMRVPANATKYV